MTSMPAQMSCCPKRVPGRDFLRNACMRFILPVILLVLALTSTASAQRYNVRPDLYRTPNDLTEYLTYLQDQQLDSLKQFTSYLQDRVQGKQVPQGVLLNVQAIYLEAQLKATPDLAEKREKLVELTDLYKKREELDARSPNTTWFGVNRVELGEMMRSEFETFTKKAQSPPVTSRR